MGNNEEIMEYDTFELDLNGRVMEFAIIEEFEFEGKTYIICGEIEGDEIKEEYYLFEGISEGEHITVNIIEEDEEYERIIDAYYDSVENEE